MVTFAGRSVCRERKEDGQTMTPFQRLPLFLRCSSVRRESATLQVCSVALFVETRGRREGIERRNRREEEGTRRRWRRSSNDKTTRFLGSGRKNGSAAQGMTSVVALRMKKTSPLWRDTKIPRPNDCQKWKRFGRGVLCYRLSACRGTGLKRGDARAVARE